MTTKKTVKKSTKRPAKKKSADFAPVFEKLRAILARHAKKLVVKDDGPTGYWLDTKLTFKKKPVFFGAVRTGKAYVSFHLFPAYVFPHILLGLSPALKKRMQGKSCFNFTEVDRELLRELATLTARGLEAFESDRLPFTPDGK